MAEPSSWRFDTLTYRRFVHDLELEDDQVLLEYIYMADDGETIRSKCCRVDTIPETARDLATSAASFPGPTDVRQLHPVAIYKDPFRRGPHRLVLCQVMGADGAPSASNFRSGCVEVMSKSEVEAVEPWFGIEQEYSVLDAHGRPVGFPNRYMPEPSSANNDAVGMHVAFGRDIYESHLFACMYAGIKISGGNLESCAGQWEFQVGPSGGVKACDDLLVARYILHRMSEEFGMAVTFKPKPVSSACYSNGGHVNVSTRPMREDGGLKVIKECLPRLAASHAHFLPLCDVTGGEDNQARLTGSYSAAPKEFVWGIENRNAAIRITCKVEQDGKGYLEDRRPASNFDPYLVTSALVRVIVLKEQTLKNPYQELPIDLNGNGTTEAYSCISS